MSKLILHKQHTRGGFSLAEAAIMIIVVGALSAISYVQIKKILKMSDIRSVITEYNNYKTAVIGFQAAYGYMPGDVPLNKLGGVLSNSLQEAQFAETNGEEKDGAVMGDARLDTRYGARLAFKQLALTNFIDSSLVESDQTWDFGKVTAGGGNNGNGNGNGNGKGDGNNDKVILNTSFMQLKTSGGVTLPFTKFSKNAVWYLTTEEKDHNSKQLAPAVLAKDVIQSKHAGELKLIMVGIRGIVDEAPVNQKGIGVLNPDMTYQIDLKVDDGLPAKNTGIVFADNTPDGEFCRTSNNDLSLSIYKDITGGQASTQCSVAFYIN